MDSHGEAVNGASNGIEKRQSDGNHDLEIEEPTTKRRKLEEHENEEATHQVAITVSGDAPVAVGVVGQTDIEVDSDNDEDSEDASFDEMMSMQQIPAERRGDHFEAWVASCRAQGKRELEILGELGFKYLVQHLDTDEDAKKLIERAIEAAKESKAELERQTAEKLKEGNGEPEAKSSEESTKPTEEAAEADKEKEKEEEPKRGGFLAALLGDDLDDDDLDDDSDDGSYDPADIMLGGGDHSESEDGGLMTDPIEILGAFSAHIRHSEDHLPPRQKLAEINGEDDAIKLIESAKKIVVLSGAGISVACGVPDFRSAGGLYDQIKEKYNLTDPQLLFDINYIRKDQVPFYDFAAQLFPSTDLKPSKAHKFIKLLQDKGKLLRNYSQNIDTLEQQVGIKSENLILCHGSFATFSCPMGHRVDGSIIKPKLDSKHIPQCEVCNDPTGAMFLKPDIVFFGESLPEAFRIHVKQDVKEADLLIVMGSSLRVQPVALVPRTF
jgi:NAD-dependent SIR2 family protein deacetylase